MASSSLLPIDAKLSILNMNYGEYSYALADNWDGQGAERITADVLALADYVLSAYATPNFLKEVSPGRTGSLSFVWDDGKKNYVYLDVGPEQTLHLYYNIEGKEKWEGVSLATDTTMHANLDTAFSFCRWNVMLFDQSREQARPTFFASFSKAA